MYRLLHAVFFFLLFLICFAALVFRCSPSSRDVIATENPAITMWLTTGDRAVLLEKQQSILFSDSSNSQAVIEIDTTQRFRPSTDSAMP
jgi:hypothetical protein